MNIYPEQEAARLPGLVEIIADRHYSRAAAKRRLEGTMPSGLTPGGIKIIIELDREPGQRSRKHLVAWWVRPGGAA